MSRTIENVIQRLRKGAGDVKVPGGQNSPLRAKTLSHQYLAALKLALYRHKHSVSWTVIAHELGTDCDKEFSSEQARKVKRSDQSLRSWQSRPAKNGLGDDLLNVVYRYLDRHAEWDSQTTGRVQIRAIPEPLYHSMLEFLDIPELTTSNLLRRLPGVYRVWRPIVTHANHFVEGLVTIAGDQDTGVLTCREYNAIKAQKDREAKILVLEGYAFRKSNFLFFTGTDTEQATIHLTLVSDAEIMGDKYHVLMGQFLDTIGGRTYSGKVIMERSAKIGIEDVEAIAAFEADADCVPRDELPPSIRNFFDHKSQVGDVTIW